MRHCDNADVGIDISNPMAVGTRLPTVSCLMTTYVRERAEWLAAALESVFAQSAAPSQLVLVLDGPVGADQEEVIARYGGDRRIAVVDVVRLPENQGLAGALSAGFERCTGEWVMRMDSDDLCDRERLRIQLDYVLENPGTDIVSSWSEEFMDGEEATRLKSSTTRHDAIVQSLRWRNVICHPAVLMRAEALRRAGGYRLNFPLLEDYDLWVRMALVGAHFHIIPAVLLRVRAGLQQSARRGGWRYCLHEVRFRVFCLRQGFLSLRQFVATTLLYVVFRLAGTLLRSRLYGFARV